MKLLRVFATSLRALGLVCLYSALLTDVIESCSDPCSPLPHPTLPRTIHRLQLYSTWSECSTVHADVASDIDPIL